ncbi:MAG TPA: DUF4129 domain-containing protein [Candidatus Limnocylindrales bacterium]|nr:DUF4129 domain-containing protein [Candidatus Limnocylindrales bacterium]
MTAAVQRARRETWSTRARNLVLPALVGLVEGAWIAVIYAAWQVGLAQGRPILGPLTLALPAWLGLWWIRSGTGSGVEVSGLGLLTIAAALAGAAADPAALGALLDGDPGRAVAQHAAGLLAGVAVLRGARHREPSLEDVTVGQLLRWVLPLLALPWIVGSLAAPGVRATFVGAAFPATLLLVTAGLLAMGLARLDEIGRTAGVDLSLRRSWLLLAAAVLVAMAVVAVPAALLLGAPLGLVLDGLFGPLATLLAIALLPLLALAAGIVALLQLVPLHAVLPSAAPAASSGPVRPISSSPNADAAVAVGGVFLLIVGFIALIVLVARWDARRRVGPRSLDGSGPSEERSLALPGEGLRFGSWRPRRRQTRPRPTDASGAYLAWLADLEGHPGRAREPTETPAAHLARLRGQVSLPLGASLLAADFELERYGRRRLSGLETRRALGRRRDLRRLSGADGPE